MIYNITSVHTCGINSFRATQDAPSISSEEDVAKLQVFLTEKMAKFYEAEHNPERETSVACIPDSRVDICMYLLEPHQLPKVDVDAIVALGKSTPIVFLLGKVSQCSCSDGRKTTGVCEFPTWACMHVTVLTVVADWHGAFNT